MEQTSLEQRQTLEFRRLRWPDDEALFRAAYHWTEAAPDWYRAVEAVDAVEMDEWLKLVKQLDHLSMGVWIDGVFSSQIVFRHIGLRWWEVYLTSLRGVRATDLSEIVFNCGSDLFERGMAAAIYAWVARLHRPSRKFAKGCGLLPDGFERWNGEVRGRLIEWERWSLTKERWLTWGDYGRKESSRSHDEPAAESAVSESVPEPAAV